MKKCAKKLSGVIKPGNTHFRIGIIGDIQGYENNAKKVIDKFNNLLYN